MKVSFLYGLETSIMIFQMQDGVVIHDEEMSERWNQKYENGYKMTEGLIIHARKEP